MLDTITIRKRAFLAIYGKRLVYSYGGKDLLLRSHMYAVCVFYLFFFPICRVFDLQLTFLRIFFRLYHRNWFIEKFHRWNQQTQHAYCIFISIWLANLQKLKTLVALIRSQHTHTMQDMVVFVCICQEKVNARFLSVFRFCVCVTFAAFDCLLDCKFSGFFFYLLVYGTVLFDIT